MTDEAMTPLDEAIENAHATSLYVLRDVERVGHEGEERPEESVISTVLEGDGGTLITRVYFAADGAVSTVVSRFDTSTGEPVDVDVTVLGNVVQVTA